MGDKHSSAGSLAPPKLLSSSQVLSQRLIELLTLLRRPLLDGPHVGDVMNLLSILRNFLPQTLVGFARRIRDRFKSGRVDTRPPREVFSEVYEKGLWGKSSDPNRPYFSGSGSHEEAIVTRYVQSVGDFLRTLPRKPNVVDLGCGDFAVGSQIRPLCERYVACDVVPSLIEHNRSEYRTLDVDFRLIDISSDELPHGDIAFIRQVLQHLPNSRIAKLVPKLEQHFTHLILTEHLPSAATFVPNLDLGSASAEIRLGKGSGIVLTKPPFNLRTVNERVLCEVSEFGGVIRTTVYQLK
jgi:hypothetical protein